MIWGHSVVGLHRRNHPRADGGLENGRDGFPLLDGPNWSKCVSPVQEPLASGESLVQPSATRGRRSQDL
jgi:hypothetical protein